MKSQLNEVQKLQKIAGILNTNHLSEKYVIPKGDEIEDDEDPLYQELANEIGEKKLQKLLMKGWELEDIAEDPQGAAASIK
jgi:hypothetical protein